MFISEFENKNTKLQSLCNVRNTQQRCENSGAKTAMRKQRCENSGAKRAVRKK